MLLVESPERIRRLDAYANAAALLSGKPSGQPLQQFGTDLLPLVTRANV